MGCIKQVKKPTNKYCSRACCTSDPERSQRLREVSRRRILPMARQLDLRMWESEDNVLAAACEEIEEAPSGLSRLTAG
ncbi:MAG: hypothetical protein QOE92_1074 [Chloroflexota bacterium]|jgi:hypothetical protein|nr:hypothetical protein [Chloroflexota bacterium]